MEALGAIALILSTVQVANSAFSALKAIRTVNDDKFDEVYWRMFAEKEKAIAWVSRMASVGYNPPPEHQEQISLLLKGLADRFQEIDQSLRGVRPRPWTSDGRRDRMNSTMIRNRFLFHLGRFEDLKQTLNAISAMNGALDVLAPRLPENLERASSSKLGFIPTTEQRQSSRMPINTSERGLPPSKQPIRSATVDTGISTTGSLKLRRPGRMNPCPLYSIHRLAIDVLEALKPTLPDQSAEVSSVISRLELWGMGVFRKQAHFGPSLDFEEIVGVMSEGRGGSFLGDFVLRNLVNVLIGAMFILETVRAKIDDDNELQSELGKLASKILVSLAQNRVKDIARDRYEELYARDAYSDDSDDGAAGDSEDEGFDEPASDSIPSVSLSVAHIKVSVDCLFEMLPSIYSCQRSYILDLEEEESVNTKITQQAAVTEQITREPAQTKPDTSLIQVREVETAPPAAPEAFNIEHHIRLIDINLELANELAETISKEGPVGSLATKLEFLYHAIHKEINLLKAYHQTLVASGANVVRPEEAKVAMEQNGVALNMVKSLYEKLRGYSRDVRPLRGTEATPVKLKEDEGEKIAMEIEGQLNEMLKEFRLDNEKLMAQRRAAQPLLAIA